MEAGLYKSMILVRSLVAALQRQGIAPTALFQDTALEGSVLADGKGRISLEDWRLLTRRAIELTGDRGLGLRIGGGTSDHMLQIVGQLATTCSTLRQAMQMVERYHALLGNTLQLDLIEEGDLAYFVCTPLMPDPMAPEFDPELVLSLVYRIARRLARLESDDAQEIWLSYPAPPHAARYNEVFKCPVRFERPRTAILLARALLDQVQPYADTRMLDVLREAAERMLTELGTPSLPDQVRALLRSETDLRNMDAGRVARMLRLHPRTFRRQLIAANSPWSELLDDTRRRIACDELRRRDVSIRDLADRLGFSEPSAFTRAFKRWTGETPAKYSRTLSGR
jgi:AraC-like DNA-binding protein